jgi:hypothetical protein
MLEIVSAKSSVKKLGISSGDAGLKEEKDCRFNGKNFSACRRVEVALTRMQELP